MFISIHHSTYKGLNCLLNSQIVYQCMLQMTVANEIYVTAGKIQHVILITFHYNNKPKILMTFMIKTSNQLSYLKNG
jgi:hypothetical protein